MHIKDEVRKCVIFIARKKPTDDQVHLCGTGFFVAIHDEDDSVFVTYLVTARHVIERIANGNTDGSVYLRLNHSDGPAELYQSDTSSWTFFEDDPRVDVAVLRIGISRKLDHKVISRQLFAKREVVEKKQIGVGDELFITGLFRNHAGEERNIPIIRMGNIAAMPHERVETRKMGKIHAYLVECRSIGGLSGSPVFVEVDEDVDKEPNSEPQINFTYYTGKRKVTEVRLLGLVHGHYDLECIEDSTDEDVQFIESLKVNMGIAIVVPTDDIVSVLEQESVAKQRSDDFDEIKRIQAESSQQEAT